MCCAVLRLNQSFTEAGYLSAKGQQGPLPMGDSTHRAAPQSVHLQPRTR